MIEQIASYRWRNRPLDIYYDVDDIDFQDTLYIYIDKNKLAGTGHMRNAIRGPGSTIPQVMEQVLKTFNFALSRIDEVEEDEGPMNGDAFREAFLAAMKELEIFEFEGKPQIKWVP